MEGIAEFLRHKTMFITGATGFLGKPLVAKILTEAPDVGTIYLLIRPKRQRDGSYLSAAERLESEVFSSSVFDRLRSIHGVGFDKFISGKVIGISGDISEENLGIEPEVYARLTGEVQIIINSAAVVIFDERLDEAFKMNTFAPLNLLNFAKSCRNALFLHVSTAYVSGGRTGYIAEEIPNHRDIDKLDVEKEYAEVMATTRKVEAASHHPRVLKSFRREALRMASGKVGTMEAALEAARERWVRQKLIDYGMKRSKAHGWNDSYTFTKALAERMIIRHRGDLPTVILRPSIIESSIYEPEPGWIDGLRMTDPLIVGYGKGRLNDFPGNPEIIIDVIPVDFVVNAMLASLMKANKEGGVKIYQVATGSVNPLKFDLLYNLTRQYFLNTPMLDKNGNPIRLSKWSFPSRRRFRLGYNLRYIIPLGLASRIAQMLPQSKWTNKQRRRIDALKTTIGRLLYYEKIYGPYTSLGYCFGTANTEKLFNELSEEDKSKFSFDISRIDWKHYIHNIHIPGLKRNILKLDISAEAPKWPEPTAQAEVPAGRLAYSFENVFEILSSTAMRLPDKVALQMKRDGEWARYTYRQIYDLALLIGSELKKAGLGKGDRAILFSEDRPEWGITYFAASSIGVALVPLDRQTPSWEVWSLADFVKAKGILASEGCLSRMESGFEKSRISNLKSQISNPESQIPNLKSQIPNPQIRVFSIDRLCLDAMSKNAKGEDVDESAEPIEQVRPDDEALEEQTESVEGVRPDDVASIIFTSGTLVEPRGSILTHRNFVSDFLAVAEVLRPYENDQFLSILPLYHAFGFTGGFLMAIYGGATVTYVDTLKPKVLLDTMQEIGATCLLGTPRLFRLLYEAISRDLSRNEKTASVEKDDYTPPPNRVRQLFGGKVRILVSGGAHLDHNTYETFQRLGLPIYEGYGLTECAPVVTVNPLGRSKKGSAGLPVPGVELKIARFDENEADGFLRDKELEEMMLSIAASDENGIGEIAVKGPNVTSGYYNNLETTQKVLRDGWLYTGDLGYLDKDGYLYITGRSKNVIVSGAGKNVYPEELEIIYKDHPYIGEICVLGIRGQESLGEEVHAVVVPRKVGTEGRDLTDIHASIRQHVQKVSKEIPTYQRVQKLHIWDDPLPKAGNLELDRKLVKKTLVEHLRFEKSPIKSQIPIEKSQIPKPKPEGSAQVESWEDEVLSWLSRVSDVPKERIGLDSDLDTDLGLDSLAKIELLLVLEEKLGGSLPDSVVESIKTVRDIVEFDKSKVALATPESKGMGFPDLNLKPRMAARIFRALVKPIYKSYFRFRCDGLENIPKEGVYLIAPNHSSHLDTPAIITALGKKAEHLFVAGALDYFFNSPLKSWFFGNFLHVIPIDRRDNSTQGVKISQHVLTSGKSLLIYPEATRSRSGEIGQFKLGIGLLAYELGVPIIPTYISGTYQALPPGRSFPKKSIIRVSFGKPIDPKSGLTVDKTSQKIDPGSKYEIYKEIVEQVRSSILDLKKG